MKKYLIISLCLYVLLLAGCSNGEKTDVGDSNIAIEEVSVDNLELLMNGDVVEEFAINFAGNTSLDTSLTLDSEYRYFCIYVKNIKSKPITVSIENAFGKEDIFQCESGSYCIWSTSEWDEGDYKVSFGSLNGLYGKAEGILCKSVEKI